MKRRFFILVCFVLRCVIGQVVDFCAENESFNYNSSECLALHGCCFINIEVEGEVNKEKVEFASHTSCVSDFNEEKDTCEQIKEITVSTGNKLLSCMCASK